MNHARPQIDLQAVAKQVMLAHGFQPDFPPAVQQQVASLQSLLVLCHSERSEESRSLTGRWAQQIPRYARNDKS